MTKEDIQNIFTYHAPKGEGPESQALKYETIRGTGYTFAEMLLDLCPGSRERSTAITKIQEAVMWANAAIAIHE